MGSAADDRHAVVELLHRYTLAVDGGDFDEVGRLFEHATFYGIGDTRPLTGPEVVQKFNDFLILYDGTPRTQHRLSNISVSFDAATRRASSRCYVAVLQQVPGRQVELILAATYDDSFEVIGGEWRFVARTASNHLYGDLSRHNRMLL